MVDGALFDQCKSDKGDEMLASCGKARLERKEDPGQAYLINSPTQRGSDEPHLYSSFSRFGNSPS